jgi:prepilin-type N-terminal cleavage/methylation domain-containing protein
MSKRKGMSLVELVIVVLILGALAAVALPRITTSASAARQNACDTNIDVINAQIEMFKLDTGAWPTDMAIDVTGSTTYFPDGAPSCPTTGTYTMNGSTYRVDCDVH